MSLSKIVKTAVVATGIVAMNIVGFVASAEARDGNRNRTSYNAPVQRYHAPIQRYHSYDNHRRNSSGNVAKGVAIGIGALILGGILASEARRQRSYDEGY